MAPPGMISVLNAPTAPAPNQDLGKMWNSRRVSYKLAIASLVVSAGLLFVGIVSQNWIVINSMNFGFHGTVWGLWTNISKLFCDSSCSLKLTVARVLLCCALCSHILLFILAGVENCRLVDTRTYHSRKLETALVLSIALGAGGLIAFHIFKLEAWPWSFDLETSTAVRWSYYLALASVGILICGFVLLLCGNSKFSSGVVVAQSANVQVAHYHTSPGTVVQPPPTQFNQVIQPLQPQYGPPPSQPLLPQYHSQPMGPPPPYIPPPAYPMGPSQGSNMIGYQPVSETETFAKASAPPAY